ncbi:type VI secretion system Vgr family protein [Variovorax ginsengisoli]|uniref:Type VI secretion system secreted protein VgrG n=1 Tax=Variovorax ginsengisoli TaxID=363844 RepID=A0ABT9SBA0_9BURK|nr:type VI secretion system tip protein TssI/VgrG [Variovorax ginsengisoli]MDP9901036.1 type VI secretion system secreted protein VgrG [Variovorax ginsengisoli]
MTELEAQFLTSLDGTEPALLFRTLVAREDLGRLPQYRVELLRLSEFSPLAAKTILGTQVDIKIQVYKDDFRYIHGFVTEFERGGVSGRYDIYRVVVTPWLWQLTQSADCRIFQDQSAVDVIVAVFAKYRSKGSVDKSKVDAGSAKRPYTVQYNESDFDFVTRLMDEEGIYFYFTHAKGQHTLVLTDNPGGHTALNLGTLAWAESRLGNALQVDIVTDWSCTHAVGSTQFVHIDFAADEPTQPLKTQATRTPPYDGHPKTLEVFRYPGGYADIAMDAKSDPQALGGQRAQIEVDRFESTRVVGVGITPFRRTAAGATFSLKGHPADDGDYLITSVRYEMSFAQYEAKQSDIKTGFACRFEAVPKATPYHPPARAPRSKIYGPQTATVVGASGDEIMTDKFGRVKLQFHWDREGRCNEESSCWVRVAQPWASKQFGMVALPRVGDEVVVEFMDGNPDRPLITGSVYNGYNLPPYDLPAQATVSGIKSRSSKGGSLSTFNELRFDDKKDSEYVWFQAEKDYHQLVKHDGFETVRNDLWTEVGKNVAHRIGENLTLTVGKQATIRIDADTHGAIGGDMITAVTGALGLSVSDAIVIKGSSSIELTSGAAMDIDVGAAMKLSAASTLHIKGLGVVIDGGTQLTLKAGGSFITLGPEGVTIQGALVKINSGGSAGAASAAAKARPPEPKAPTEPKQNQDPLAK